LVDDVKKNYPSPVTFNILLGVGLAMAISCLLLGVRMNTLATKKTQLTASDIAGK